MSAANLWPTVEATRADEAQWRQAVQERLDALRGDVAENKSDSRDQHDAVMAALSDVRDAQKNGLVRRLLSTIESLGASGGLKYVVLLLGLIVAGLWGLQITWGDLSVSTDGTENDATHGNMEE